jgi:hypothetical protein
MKLMLVPGKHVAAGTSSDGKNIEYYFSVLNESWNLQVW